MKFKKQIFIKNLQRTNMKNILIIILTLLPLITFSQIPDGTYKHATITVLGGIVSAVDSTQEVDPTVDIDVKNITNADLNRWNDAAVLLASGYPNYTLLDYLINHVWIPQSTDALAEGTTNLYYSMAKFNAALNSKTTDNLSEGLTHKYFSNSLARNSISVSGSALGYNSGTGTLSIVTANTSQGGIISNTDWNLFNNKQPSLGFIPIPNSRTLTINGITQDQTSDRSWSITSITGNSGTATALQTARTINGQSFDGTSNIIIPGSTISNIPNSSLANNSITVNGNSIPLGGSTTITASPSISAPTAGNTLSSGVAFQPRPLGPCNINISSSLGSGLAAVTGTIVIATSPTQNGTYTTVTTDGVILSLLNSSLDRSSATIPVPSGHWVKVTYTTVGLGATLAGTYTKWDF